MAIGNKPAEVGKSLLSVCASDYEWPPVQYNFQHCHTWRIDGDCKANSWI